MEMLDIYFILQKYLKQIKFFTHNFYRRLNVHIKTKKSNISIFLA